VGCYFSLFTFHFSLFTFHCSLLTIHYSLLTTHFSLMKSGQWYVLAAAILWGTTGTAQALMPAAASPLAVGAVRLALGGAVLLLWAWVKGGLRDGRVWPKRPLIIGAVAVAAYQPLFFGGVARTGVAVGTMVAIGSAPVLAGMLVWAMGGVRPSSHWFVATLLAVSGCSLLALVGDSDVAVDPGGILLAVGAGGCYAVFALAAKGLLASHSPDTVMAVLFSLGAVLLLPLWLTADLSWLAEPRGLAAALELGLVATALAYLLYARGLASVAVATAVTLSLAEPLTAALLGIFLLGEPVTWPVLVGVGAIFSGLLIITRHNDST
jgi:DME family drug/metabolite transporter